MKLLNEANLAYFSTCSSQSTKEGWLYKKGEVHKSFQKRWFVLKGNLLFYFDKPGEKEPNGVIILEGYTVELFDGPTDGFTFQIVFNGASNARRYVLQAESHQVMEEWMKTITCASYDYMKLMVAELKSQLDELIAQELSSELAECKSRSGSFDPFGQEPFVPMAASRVVKDVNDIKEPTCSDKRADGEEHTVTKTRLNPFDRNVPEEGCIVDPFGQVPFNPQPNSNPPSSTLRVPPPVPLAPSRKKNSPKILRKVGSSPKVSRKGGDHPVAASAGKTQFYEDAQEYYKKHLPPTTSIVSRFNELHTFYGNQIKSTLVKVAACMSDSASSDTLIDFG